MTMKRLFAVVLALCLTASALCGCATENPAETTGAAQTGREEETIYLLTMQEEKNDQGEVFSRTTYTYDDRGLVLTKEMDVNNLTVWNEELLRLHFFDQSTGDSIWSCGYALYI